MYGVAARGEQFDEQSLADLRLLRDLQVLEISSPNVDDKVAPYLEDLIHLRHLYISETTITAEGLARLANLARLESATISSYQLKSPTVAWLASRSISGLAVDAAVTSSQIRALNQLTELRNLTLFDAHDAIAPELLSLDQIAMLHVESDLFTDASLKTLEHGLPNLQSLLLRDTLATQRGVERLERSRPALDVQIYLSTSQRRHLWNTPTTSAQATVP